MSRLDKIAETARAQIASASGGGAFSIFGAAQAGVGIRAAFNSEAITQHLRRLAALDAARFGGATREIGEYLLGEVQDNLDGQRLFDGSAMPQSKAAITRRGKTLIDKHHLYDSYTYQLRGDGVEVGSSLIYSLIHHAGGATGRGHKTHLPARPVLGVGARQERRIGDLLIAEIEGMQ